ncbi:hypothetical protein CYMTET_10760 [Cymbomonas tetramitiformis]|uniref:Uncharacterized protein n=1 Tax=Cymbomonas tetramitiformis TaxID=36881 RepID=A0AAE0GNV3_9CHLO|nr:hypothetical protein CYMTET_10760 [Cymbomonas tetramitiformis]
MEMVKETTSSILDWTDNLVKNKPEFISRFYLATGVMTFGFMVASFCCVERCLYDDCITGYGIDQLNRVHYGISHQALQTILLFSAQSIFGFWWFRREDAKVSLSDWVYAFLLGTTAMSVFISVTTWILWDCYAWIDKNLKINGDIYQDETYKQVVDLESGFRAMQVFAMSLFCLFSTFTPCMYWWGKKSLCQEQEQTPIATNHMTFSSTASYQVSDNL